MEQLLASFKNKADDNEIMVVDSMKKTHKMNGIRLTLMIAACLMVLSVVLIYTFGNKTALNVSLSTKFGFAQFYAFPILFGAIGTFCSLAVIVLLICRTEQRNTFFCINFSMCALLAVSFAAYATSGSDSRRTTADEHLGKTFKFVEWNALDSLDKDSAKTVFCDFDADVAVFPELGGYSKGESASRRIQDIFKECGVDADLYDVFSSPPTAGSIAPVTVIVKKAFASYEVKTKNDMTMYGTVYLSSPAEEIPDIIGLHTSPPLPGMMSIWERDIDLITELTGTHKNAIIAGDFNATLRHGSLNLIADHYDALETLSVFKRGTWPVKLPALFRASIDHILLPECYSVKNAETRSLSGSDHAAIFAELYSLAKTE